MNILWQMDPPGKLSRDAFNMSIHNLADEPTLTDGTPLHPNAKCQFHTVTDI